MISIPDEDQVLVAILRSQQDFVFAKEEQWYRIPQDVKESRLKDRWPPHWVAFYRGAEFRAQAHRVDCYAQVRDWREVPRGELFPDQAHDRRWYALLELGPLQRMQLPIPSHTSRRIVFIQTTGRKFKTAEEINDLFDDSPLENRLWAELKFYKIPAERQVHVYANDRNYFVDFAVYCNRGNLAVETDGDTWHHNPADAEKDNQRDNDLMAVGWKVQHFTRKQIEDEMVSCLRSIRDTIHQTGGLYTRGTTGRRDNLDPDEPYQLSFLRDLE
jgi:very-short-patch-repair endonuclease